LVTVIAVLYRGEPATAIKVAGVVLIVVGVVLVNVSSRDS
jgi:multidrug transporter EmrE-like cation transporter